MIGNRIKLIRLANRLSLQQLASSLTEASTPITKAALSNYETGKNTPTEVTLSALSRELGVSLPFFHQPDWDDFSVTLVGVPAVATARLQELTAYVQIELERYLLVEQAIGINSLQHQTPFEPIPVCTANPDGIEEASLTIRQRFGLGEYAIASVCQFLEGEGWCLFLLPDAFSVQCFSGYEYSHGIPFLFCAPTPYLDEYRRLLMAEFGRSVLAFRAEDEDFVLARFSRAMLLPRPRLIQEFGITRTCIRKDELVTIKQKYGLARRAIMERLLECHIITENYYNDFSMYLNQHSFLRREISPSTLLHFYEEPTRYTMHVSRARAESSAASHFDSYFL